MTEYQYKIALEKELEHLNKKIDLKIVYGCGYAKEARRHKMLTARARKLQRGSIVSQFMNIFRPFSHA